MANKKLKNKKRIQFFKERYCEFKISKPLEEPIVTGNQATIHYCINLKTRDGEKRSVQIMAMATLENEKICRWIQVVGETHQGSWDKK